ncbi:uncharacterized protein LOC132714843 [Ruditapes philippinarum]|uniref:uncharacterized protein LOC132714843 n=1 Tax=Ruditapes philippinarum TaxID=129788 RepID=UPI00295B0896|nr:uncharacterized protein LOC132714843 [Ruditapes philippinarum]
MLGSQKRTVVCLEEDVGAALSTQLERHALAGIRVACDKLYVILTGNTTEGISNTGEPSVNSENVESTKQRSKSAGSSVKDSPRQAYRHLSVTTEQIPCVKGKQGKIKSPKSGTPVELSDTDSELIERLYYEFVGLFNRSILPEDEKPSHSECLYKIDKTILQELQELSNSITSCGYRYSTLHVNVNVKTTSDDLKHSIGHVMEKHNITKYSVVPSVIQEFSTCNVGQGVRVEYVKNEFYTGTLGGFAYTSSGESKRDWAILSRHFAKSSFDRKLYVAKQENMYIGEIMKEVKDDETNKEYLDIAAASLDDNISSDKTYVTEKNESVQGKLFSYDAKKLMCLPVHIKGAKTELGLGTISVPEQIAVQNDNLDENYIIVEDREEGNAFCQEGDSGAIVCAENPDKYGEEVHLISMVMGENMSKKGSYTTVRLDKGLDQLKSLTNKDFNMY